MMLKGVMYELVFGNLDWLLIDVGLVIDVEVKQMIDMYVVVMKDKGYMVM